MAITPLARVLLSRSATLFCCGVARTVCCRVMPLLSHHSLNSFPMYSPPLLSHSSFTFAPRFIGVQESFIDGRYVEDVYASENGRDLGGVQSASDITSYLGFSSVVVSSQPSFGTCWCTLSVLKYAKGVEFECSSDKVVLPLNDCVDTEFQRSGG